MFEMPDNSGVSLFRQNDTAPQCLQTLQIREYVTSHDNGDFANIIKVMHLKIGSLSSIIRVSAI